jgi:hypothetical protein
MQSTIQKITESQSGRTLSDAHRAAISAGQRRRHATRRFLVAMEALHQELMVTCDDVPTPPAAEPQQPADEPEAPVPVETPRERASVPTGAPAASAASNLGKSVSMLADEQLDDVHREYAMRLKDFRKCALPACTHCRLHTLQPSRESVGPLQAEDRASAVDGRV